MHASGGWSCIIAFSDGVQIGAVLDQMASSIRYYVTSDDRVILASEVGVLPSIQSSSLKKVS